MTVQVISRKPTPASKEIKCHKCEAKLRYKVSDIKHGVDIDRSGHKESYKFIVCPDCNTEVVV